MNNQEEVVVHTTTGGTVGEIPTTTHNDPIVSGTDPNPIVGAGSEPVGEAATGTIFNEDQAVVGPDPSMMQHENIDLPPQMGGVPNPSGPPGGDPEQGPMGGPEEGNETVEGFEDTGKGGYAAD